MNASENVSQQLEIKAEVTYFNGTDYVKVALPILINLVGDVGETFEDARAITEGSYVGSISEWHDAFDYYKIWLAEGQNIRISPVLRDICGVNITLHDPIETPKADVKPILNPHDNPFVMDAMRHLHNRTTRLHNAQRQHVDSLLLHLGKLQPIRRLHNSQTILGQQHIQHTHTKHPTQLNAHIF